MSTLNAALSSLSLKRIPFGVVVLAEPGVEPAEMRRDLETIRELGFNTIVLYPSVSRWEGQPPGQTAFETIDRIMDWCAELGLKVVLELQGQVMQDADAPECFGFVQPANYRENGFHHPVKEALLARYLVEVATHFRGHPALLAYDIFNEIGSNSRSPETIRAFVEFLKVQYATIGELNLAWATYFTDFAAIADAPPQYQVWSWSSVVAERDWQRFRSRDFTERASWWRSLLREADPATPLFLDVLGSDVLHNRTDDYFGVSDWDAVEQSDVLGLSCYANLLAVDWWKKDAWLWPQFWRHARSVAGARQTIISELMTPNRNLFPVEKSSMTDEIRLWSYQALFHGIQGVIYWKYRPFRRGRQVSGRGLTDFAGRPNRHGRQASEAAHFARRHEALLAAATPDNAGCAIVHDPEAERLYKAIGIQPETFYTDTHRGWFHAFWSKGVAPAYVNPARFPDGWSGATRVLVVPCLASVSDATARTLRHFVHEGGTLVTESRFGLLDENGTLRGSFGPDSLFAEMGWTEADFTCRGLRVVEGDGVRLELEEAHFQVLDCAPQTEVLLRTRDGAPALIRKRFGQGQFVHVPFLLGHTLERELTAAGSLAFFGRLFEEIAASLQPAVAVLEKSPLLDVSTLLDPAGRPCLTGLCNYGHETGTVTLRFPAGVAIREVHGAEDAVAVDGAGVARVTLAARSVLGLFPEFSPA